MKRQKNEFINHQNFTILQELGKGSYGTVYKVKSNIDNNLYVLKKINLAQIKNQNEALKEARLLSSLKHPNIIRFYMSFIEENYLCIVMEYAEGGDLQNYLKEQKENHQYLSEEKVWKIAYQLCSALLHIHQNNIIHRDIKALNIFLTKDKQVKLGDLGVSKIFTSEVALNGTRVGTPLYLAPELIQHQPYDFKVDVWALGCVLYYLCALELPFQGENLISLGQNIVNHSPKPIPPQYSQHLTKLIWNLLEKIPILRLSIEEVINTYFQCKSTQIKNQVSVFQQINSSLDENPYQFEKKNHRPQTSNGISHNEKKLKTNKMKQNQYHISSKQIESKQFKNKADEYYSLVKQAQQQLDNEETVQRDENQKDECNSLKKSGVYENQLIEKQQVCYDKPHLSARIFKIQQNQIIDLYLDDKILQKQNQCRLNDNYNKQKQNSHGLMQIRPLSSQARSYSLKNLAIQSKQPLISNQQEVKKFTIFDLKGDKERAQVVKQEEKQNEQIEKNTKPVNQYQIDQSAQQKQITRIQSAFLINQKTNFMQSQDNANKIIKHYTLKDLLEI